MISHQDARRATRQLVNLNCDLISAHWDHPVRARAFNLSLVGVGIRTSFPLEEGDRVVLSFAGALGTEMLTLFANVRRVSCGDDYLLSGEAGVELEFENLSANEQGVLAAALRKPVLSC